MFHFKKISTLICALLTFSSFNFTNAYDKYAKVVFIGQVGSGKTVLYNLLTPKNYNKTIDEVIHTKQISDETDIYNIDGKSVCVYFSDTSGEPRHEALMKAFCHNAHLVFIMMDALKLANMGLSGTKESEELENLITHLYEYAPKCRVVVVLTRMEAVEKMYGYSKEKLEFTKNKIEMYIKGIKFSVKGNVDTTYELMLYNPNKAARLIKYGKSKQQVIQEKNEHKIKLKGIIEDCLKKFGINNLPDKSDGLRAEVVHEIVGYEKVIDQEYKEGGACSSGQPEQSHIVTKYEDKLYVK